MLGNFLKLEVTSRDTFSVQRASTERNRANSIYHPVISKDCSLQLKTLQVMIYHPVISKDCKQPSVNKDTYITSSGQVWTRDSFEELGLLDR